MCDEIEKAKKQLREVGIQTKYKQDGSINRHKARPVVKATSRSPCWLKLASTLPCGGGHIGPSHIRNGVRLGGPSHVRSDVRLGGPSHVRSDVRLIGPSHNRDPWTLYLYTLSELVAYF
uniref:Uncharacterized protein n=1 Tax=Ananas comosus var. bracteatus TaxID=296719 RepID=A0A6V7PPY6_ANACO|nr:unnamed protein product [Ananas comosus var. bracteatus]